MVVVQQREPPTLCAIKSIICVLNHHLHHQHLQGTHTHTPCMASLMRSDSHQNCDQKSFSEPKTCWKNHCIYTWYNKDPQEINNLFQSIPIWKLDNMKKNWLTCPPTNVIA
jgi:hypothetical protein